MSYKIIIAVFVTSVSLLLMILSSGCNKKEVTDDSKYKDTNIRVADKTPSIDEQLKNLKNGIPTFSDNEIVRMLTISFKNGHPAGPWTYILDNPIITIEEKYPINNRKELPVRLFIKGTGRKFIASTDRPIPLEINESQHIYVSKNDFGKLHITDESRTSSITQK